MNSQYHSHISRLEKEIAGHDKTLATLAKQESDSVAKINKAQSAMNKAASISTLNSKAREYERETKRLAETKKKQSDISTKRANATKKLRDYQKRQADADESARKREEREQRKFMQEREAHQRRMNQAAADASWPPQAQTSPFPANNLDAQYDFFICHASEDKDDIVRDLAKLLRDKGATVWYDEFTLRVGSRLRKAIERGLTKSRFGVVVISEHFFAKDWPQRELDGLFALDNNASDSQTQSRILPIWHKISKDEVLSRSPIVADLVALNTATLSCEEIADQLLDRLAAE